MFDKTGSTHDYFDPTDIVSTFANSNRGPECGLVLPLLYPENIFGLEGTCCFLEVLHSFGLISNSGAGTGYAGVPRILLAYLHLIIALTWAHFQSLDRSVLVRLNLPRTSPNIGPASNMILMIDPHRR